MKYKIECRYLYGWDDAEWTEEFGGIVAPLRFKSTEEARTALNAFFAQIRTAVLEGNLDVEERSEHYRIVPAAD